MPQRYIPGDILEIPLRYILEIYLSWRYLREIVSSGYISKCIPRIPSRDVPEIHSWRYPGNTSEIYPRDIFILEISPRASILRTYFTMFTKDILTQIYIADNTPQGDPIPAISAVQNATKIKQLSVSPGQNHRHKGSKVTSQFKASRHTLRAHMSRIGSRRCMPELGRLCPLRNQQT